MYVFQAEAQPTASISQRPVVREPSDAHNTQLS